MGNRIAGARLSSLLWFVAGILALSAAGIRYARDAEISWRWVIAGVFCFGMGISAWSRAEPRDAADRGPGA
jgi:hypothetical protein